MNDTKLYGNVQACIHVKRYGRSTNYVSKIVSIIEANGLAAWDKEVLNTSTTATKSASGSISVVQTWLNKEYPAIPYNLAVDNKDGKLTKKKIVWNAQRELAVRGRSVGTIDGVAGAKFKAGWITLKKGDSGNLVYL